MSIAYSSCDAINSKPRLTIGGSQFTTLTMRLVIQRVSEAKVTVEGKEIGSIERGLCLFLGVAKDDTEEDSTYLAQKTVDLRIFADKEGKFNQTRSTN